MTTPDSYRALLGQIRERYRSGQPAAELYRRARQLYRELSREGTA